MKISLDEIKITKHIEGKEFIYICNSKNVYEKKGIKVEFTEEADMQVAIFRLKGELFCVSNICPHRHTDHIYEGIIEDKNIICPVHGWTYSLETGKNINPHQGLRSLIHYDILEIEDKIYIEKPDLIIAEWKKNL